MNHVRGVGRARSILQPAFDFRIEKHGGGAGEGHGSTDVIEQDLHQPAESKGAKAFRQPRIAIDRRRPWQAERSRPVWKELWVVESLCRTRELEHEGRRREGHQLISGVIVREVVVIVLEEEHGGRPKRRAVNRNDLWTSSELQHRLIAAAENER